MIYKYIINVGNGLNPVGEFNYVSTTTYCASVSTKFIVYFENGILIVNDCPDHYLLYSNSKIDVFNIPDDIQNAIHLVRIK